MCNSVDIRTIFNSDLSESQKIERIQIETNKEIILEYLDANEDLGVSYEELGINADDLVGKGFELNDEDFNIGKEQFRKEDFNSNIMNLYKYDSYIYGSRGHGKNSRDFCVRLSNRTKGSLMRYRDILRLNGSNPGFGQGGSNVYSVFLYRGGSNCKHFWTKYYYDKKEMKILGVAPNGDQPRQVHKGNMPPPKK